LSGGKKKKSNSSGRRRGGSVHREKGVTEENPEVEKWRQGR